MMLIRDRDRMVWSAVSTSPKMNDSDVESIAKMRNVAPAVLREISKTVNESRAIPSPTSS
jgi:hypothetical protein